MGVFVTEIRIAITWYYEGTCLCRWIHMREFCTLEIIKGKI